MFSSVKKRLNFAMGDEVRTVWCGNLSDKVTEELLYELFLQVAPLERVRIPQDREGRKSNFAFITMKHEVSVEYAVQMLDGTSLFDRRLNIKRRHQPQSQQQQPTRPPPIMLDNQNLMTNFNDLFHMGLLMQVNYNNNANQNMAQYEQRRDRGHSRDRHEANWTHNKPYSRHDNNQRYGRNHGRNNHRGFNDRNNRNRY